MLIIFDLDDTLVDTSACITPVKLVHALLKMRESGLVLPNWEDAEIALKRLNEERESAREALKEFLDNHGADQKFLEIGLKEIYENLSFEMPIFPVRGAIELLDDLKGAHELAVVTVGKEERQLAKMEKAGIDRTLFCKIVATEHPSKKSHYQALIRDRGVSSRDVLVLGDRVTGDLAPAKELGCKTVHVKRGRGQNRLGSKKDVDFAVSDLTEVKKIIEKMMHDEHRS